MSDDQYSNEHIRLREMALAALRRAAANAWKLSRQTNTPFIVYQDGKIVDLNAPQTPPPHKKTDSTRG